RKDKLVGRAVTRIRVRERGANNVVDRKSVGSIIGGEVINYNRTGREARVVRDRRGSWSRGRCSTGIESSKHATAIRLAHDRCLLGAAAIVWRHATGGGHATVGVCRHHTTFAVDGHIVKVEQVSIIPAGQATQTDRSLLHRIAWCCVDG